MGKVYSYSEIKQKRIPTQKDFSIAKDETLKALSSFVQNGEIYGAKVFGSVAHGTPSQRSDFDLVVVTQVQDDFGTLRDIFQNIFQKTSVAIEPIILSRDFAEQGFHSIDAYFLNNHLRTVPSVDNVVGSDPSFLIQPQPISMLLSHRQYLADKVRRFTEGMFTLSPEDKVKALQRALEAPVNVGRRTMQVLHGELGYATEIIDDRKSAVIKAFRENFRDSELVKGFDILVERDTHYAQVLQDAVEGNISQQQYENTVRDLTSECIPQALRWTTELSNVYLHLTEGNRAVIERQFHYGKEL